MELLSIRSTDLDKVEKYQALDIRDFSIQDLEVHQAKQSRILKSYADFELLEKSKEIWFFIKQKWGLKDNSAQEEHISICNLMDDILSVNRITLSEVYLCIKMAMNGTYGDATFFNSVKFRGWLKKYADESQITAGKIQLALDAKQEISKPLPTDEELKAEAIKIANSYILKVTDAENKEEVYQWAGGLNHLYDIANRFGLIKLTNERKWAILNQCNNDKDLAKAETYKLWIAELAEAGMELDEFGEIA